MDNLNQYIKKSHLRMVEKFNQDLESFRKDLKKVIDGFQLLVKYGIQGKIEIQEFDCKQIAIALHKATTMEDAIIDNLK